MKIVFINPWSQDEEGVKWSSDYQTHYWRNAYFGLVQIATYARSLGHEVVVIDAERDLLMEARGKTKLLLKQIRQKVTRLRPDVVGVSGMSWRYPAASKLFDVLAPLSAKIGFGLIQGGHHAIAYVSLTSFNSRSRKKVKTQFRNFTIVTGKTLFSRNYSKEDFIISY